MFLSVCVEGVGVGADGEECEVGGLGPAWGPVGGHGELEIQGGVWLAGNTTPIPGCQSDGTPCSDLGITSLEGQEPGCSTLLGLRMPTSYPH